MTSSSETLKKRVEVVLDMALTTISSLSESFIATTNTWDDGGTLESGGDTTKAAELTKVASKPVSAGSDTSGIKTGDSDDSEAEGDLEIHT